MSEPMSPNQLLAEAKKAYEMGNFVESAHTFEAAAQAFTSSGDELMASEMRNNSSVAFLQAGEAESALQAVEGTAAIFANAGDIRRQGMALGNLGAALEAVNLLDESVEAYMQSADLLKQAGDTDLRLHVMRSISALQLRTGRQIEALATMQAGLEDVDKPSPKQRFLKRLLDIPSRLMNKS
ncbi:MAG TPA: hypothetical protein VLA49_12390 [Anaerolineales bacterium]|nr:hypothetical protein [Anaerolineales bacterium]